MHTLWTEEDEASLLVLKEFKSDIPETALGRLEALKKRELKITATNMTTPEMSALIEQLQQQTKDQLAAPATSVGRTVAVEETTEEPDYDSALWLHCRAIVALRKWRQRVPPSISDIAYCG